MSAAGRVWSALRGERTLTVFAVIAVVAVVSCVVVGVRWQATAGSPAAAGAEARDAALRDGTRTLTVLNSVDHRSAESDVDRWLSVTAGQLHRQLTGDRDEHVEKATERETDATATVQRSALSELDGDRGRARMLAVVRVELAGAQVRRSGLVVDLTRDGEVWKVSGVQESGS